MYGAVASWMARVPVRLYCQWGMVYVTMRGIKRMLFEKIERMVCRFSTHVQPDSKGNLNFCRDHGLYDEKIRVVLFGMEVLKDSIWRHTIFQRKSFIHGKSNISMAFPKVFLWLDLRAF